MSKSWSQQRRSVYATSVMSNDLSEHRAIRGSLEIFDQRPMGNFSHCENRQRYRAGNQGNRLPLLCSNMQPITRITYSHAPVEESLGFLSGNKLRLMMASSGKKALSECFLHGARKASLKIVESVRSSGRAETYSAKIPSISEMEGPNMLKDPILWYITLPEKAQRHYFDQKEKEMLSQSCPKTLRHGSLESKLRKQCQTAQIRSRQNIQKLPMTRRSDSRGREKRGLSDDVALSSCIERTNSQMCGFDNVGQMKTPSIQSLNCSKSGEGSKSERPVVQYGQQLKTQKRSFRKSFCLKPVPLPAPELAPSTLHEPI